MTCWGPTASQELSQDVIQVASSRTAALNHLCCHFIGEELEGRRGQVKWETPILSSPSEAAFETVGLPGLLFVWAAAWIWFKFF